MKRAAGPTGGGDPATPQSGPPDGAPGLPPGLDVGRLSPAERRVLDHALAGRSAREIAERLVLSEATVRSHLSRIYAKLEVAGQVELLARAGQRSATGLVTAAGARGAVAAPAMRSSPGVSSWAPLALLLATLAVLSVVFPPLSIAAGPGLLIAAWLAGRGTADAVLRSWRPWLIVGGIALTIWASVVLIAIIGVVSVGGGGSAA